MPRLKGSADLLEDRRKRALALLDSGESLNEVGRRIGCNPSSVMRWRDARRRGGAKAFLSRTPAEVGADAPTALGRPSPAGADDARLPDQSLDHGSHCVIDPESVRNPVPPRSRRTLDAQSELEPAETRTPRPGEG